MTEFPMRSVFDITENGLLAVMGVAFATATAIVLCANIAW
jgi:hypothetical protein